MILKQYGIDSICVELKFIMNGSVLLTYSAFLESMNGFGRLKLLRIAVRTDSDHKIYGHE